MRDATENPRTLPSLHIFKPGRTEVVHRVYSPVNDRYVMSFGLLVPFVLQPPGQEEEIDFTSIWEHAAAVLQGDQILDEGWPKPRAELLAAGHCYPPPGFDSQPVSAHISVGQLQKRLAVFGQRRMTATGFSAPEPFTRMPITHAHAFGGPGHEYNPDGKGMPGNDGEVQLPNIELPNHLMVSGRERPPVAGFGPIPAVWPERAQYLGRQDEHWRNTRWPHLPVDSDARYFMAAPPDQHLPGYWSGGEAIVVQNMHPEFPELRGQVPHSRPRFFVHQSTPDSQAHFHELNVQIDTIWLLPEERLGIMIFRSSIPVHDPNGRDINAFQAEFENPAEPPYPLEAYLNRCLKDMAPEVFKDVPDALSPEFQKEVESLNDEEVLAKVREQRQHFEASLSEAGIDEEQLLKTLQANPYTRQLAQAILERSHSLTGFFDEIESLVKFIQSEELPGGTKNKEPQQPDLTQALTPYPEPAAHAVKSAPAANTGAEVLHDATAAAHNRQQVMNLVANGRPCANLDLSHANLAGLDLSGLDFSASILAGANLAGAQLQGVNLTDAYLVGARFDAADLSGGQLAGASMAGASFVGATLKGANLDGGDCSQANFSGADLSGTSLRGTTLSGAWLQSIRAERLIASHAQFDHANLDNAQLPAAVLEDASLSGASARGINLEAATASRLNLSQTDLYGANLTHARLDESQAGPGSSLDKVRLDSAVLENAGWMGASLRQASMTGLQAQGADFSDTDLRGARAGRSDLRNASFDRAMLEEADLAASNLMEASFMHSRLQRCNFEHSNLFNATFMDADIAGARFDHANIERTILSSE